MAVDRAPATTPDARDGRDVHDPVDVRDAARMSRTDRVVEQITGMILAGRLTAGQRLPVEKDLAAELDVSRGSLREGVRALSVLGVLETRQGDGTYVTALDPALLVGPLGLVVELQSAGQALHLHAVRRLLETEAAGLAASRHGSAGGPISLARRALDDAAEVLATAGAADDEGPPRTTGTPEPGDTARAGLHDRFLAADIDFHRAIAEASGNPVLAALVDALGGRTARHRLRRGRTQAGADERTQHEHRAVLDAIVDGDAERARVRMAAHLLEVEDFLRDAGA